LLTAQLQHQDPSNPTSTDSFTSELAQFAGVEQQVQTNTNLTTLVNATQNSELTNSLGLVGKTASVAMSTLPLQQGKASMEFTTATSEPIAIAVTDAAGNVVKTASFSSQVGQNTWTWDGTSDSGAQMADGSYNVGINTSDPDGNSVPITPTVNGTITGVSKDGSGIVLQMGDTSANMNTLSSVGNS